MRSLIAASLLIGCTGTDPATDPPTPIPGDAANYTGSLGSDPDFSDAHGRITGQIYLFENTAVLSGSFSDGPRIRFHEEAERSGSCRLMTYTPSTCDPGCDPGAEACVAGACVPYPSRQSHGSLTWTFPGGSQEVTPDGIDGYYATATVSDEGPMTLTVDGSTLEVPTAPAMEPDGVWEEMLADRAGGDGVLRWSNPMEGARVRLHMTDCTGSHGGFAPAEIECEGPDTGELVIPAAYLDTLEAGDWDRGECGSHTWQRYHAGAPEGDDTLRFEALSPDGLFFRPDW